MQPNIEVGIISASSFTFVLNGVFKVGNSEQTLRGEGVAQIQQNTCLLRVNEKEITVPLPLELKPLDYRTASFDLKGVVIGIGFHWERREDQRFRGTLRIIREGHLLTAVNRLFIEDYLISVISSEMRATSSSQLLRAHAVISRSWLLAQMEKEQKLKVGGSYSTIHESAQETIKWYDREDHLNYDVCADDHCQRYQGITKASVPEVEKAVSDTFGEVLISDGAIADARFSKCCGGVTELFENVWEPLHHSYLTKVIDAEQIPKGFDLDLTQEAAAREWIMGEPSAFCNTHDGRILSQVLNDYDQETSDFYRWTVTLSREEIKALLFRKIDVDLGDILDLIPVERGVSGRLIRLKIIGTIGTKTIGKELEIRKALSESHLYSSAFVVEKEPGEDGIPRSFTLRGAGWGHGVGLCQIGAAVMGAKGYSYQEILSHYFCGAKLERRY